MTIPQALQAALQAHQAGRLPQAEQFYRQVLALDPNHPDALHLLGVVGIHAGHSAPAIELITRAIAIKPGVAEFHNNLGVALNETGQTDRAIEAFRHAIELKPDYSEAHASLATALKKSGKFDDALLAYGRVAELRPDSPQTLVNFADALVKANRLDEAITALRRAIELDPKLPEPYNNLGNALRYKHLTDEAIEQYHQALKLRPEFPEALNNLGTTLRTKDSYRAAIEAFSQSIRLRPDYFKAIYNLASVFFDIGQLEPALAGYQRALELRPDDNAIPINIGNVMKDQGRLDEAIAWYEKSAAADPADLRPASNRVYLLNFHPGYDAPAILREQKRWNEQYARSLMPPSLDFPNDRSPDRRLKIGYVSPDFREHVVGRNIFPLLRDHDREKFEIFCYSTVRHPDAMTDRFKAKSDHWRNCYRVHDKSVTEKICADQIDILVDLTLHMSHGRLLVFARKPAPVQVTFGGYPGGTGLQAIDYRLSDPYLDPPDAPDTFQVERCVRLPDTFWCYDVEGMDLADYPQVNPLPAETTGHITFGCLNNFCKVNNLVLDLWGQTLAKVPNSRLFLLSSAGGQRQAVLAQLARHGITPDRIEFQDRCPRDKYLTFYNRIDIGLDTFPYNGHTTSLDSLWMGVPVITLIGSTIVGRAGLSQLSNLGLTELAAKTPDEFISIAADLAGDVPRLAKLRASLRDRMKNSPLTDAASFTHNIEDAYRGMWRTWTST